MWGIYASCETSAGCDYPPLGSAEEDLQGFGVVVDRRAKLLLDEIILTFGYLA